MRSKVMFPLRYRVREWTLVIADTFFGILCSFIVMGIVQNLLWFILFKKYHPSHAHFKYTFHLDCTLRLATFSFPRRFTE